MCKAGSYFDRVKRTTPRFLQIVETSFFPGRGEVRTNCPDFRFRRRRQRVTGVRGVVEIIMLLPAQTAARVRKQAAELLVRYLWGDFLDMHTSIFVTDLLDNAFLRVDKFWGGLKNEDPCAWRIHR